MMAGIWTPHLAKAFSEYHVITKGCSTTAAEKYCRIAGLFFGWVYSHSLPLTRDTVEEWMKHLAINCGNHSNATRASRLSSLRSVCNWMVDKGHLKANPCDGVPTPKFSRKSAQKFSPSELIALFSDIEHPTDTEFRDRCIVLLFYATGLRRNEMANVTLDRVALGARTGRIHVIGKGSKHRVVPFEGPIVPALKTWLIIRQKYADPALTSLFVALHGNQNRQSGHGLGNGGLHSVIKRVARRVGLSDQNVFLHKLRSTYATDLYDADIPVGEIRILMGHAKEETTWGYIAISERHLQKARIPSSRWKQLGVTS